MFTPHSAYRLDIKMTLLSELVGSTGGPLAGLKKGRTSGTHSTSSNTCRPMYTCGATCRVNVAVTDMQALCVLLRSSVTNPTYSKSCIQRPFKRSRNCGLCRRVVLKLWYSSISLVVLDPHIWWSLQTGVPSIQVVTTDRRSFYTGGHYRQAVLLYRWSLQTGGPSIQVVTTDRRSFYTGGLCRQVSL